MVGNSEVVEVVELRWMKLLQSVLGQFVLLFRQNSWK
jgi:hypothetical protein